MSYTFDPGFQSSDPNNNPNQHSHPPGPGTPQHPSAAGQVGGQHLQYTQPVPIAESGNSGNNSSGFNSGGSTGAGKSAQGPSKFMRVLVLALVLQVGVAIGGGAVYLHLSGKVNDLADSIEAGGGSEGADADSMFSNGLGSVPIAEDVTNTTEGMEPLTAEGAEADGFTFGGEGNLIWMPYAGDNWSANVEVAVTSRTEVLFQYKVDGSPIGLVACHSGSQRGLDITDFTDEYNVWTALASSHLSSSSMMYSSPDTIDGTNYAIDGRAAMTFDTQQTIYVGTDDEKKEYTVYEEPATYDVGAFVIDRANGDPAVCFYRTSQAAEGAVDELKAMFEQARVVQ